MKKQRPSYSSACNRGEGDEKVKASEKQVCRSGAFGRIAKLALELAQSVEQVGYQGGGIISKSAVQVQGSAVRTVGPLLGKVGILVQKESLGHDPFFEAYGHFLLKIIALISRDQTRGWWK